MTITYSPPQGSPPPGQNTWTPPSEPTPPILVTQAAAPPPPVDDNAALIEMLKSVMVNPATSVERAQQAFEQFQKISADRARLAFDNAMVEMQPKLPVIERLGIGEHAKHAKWEDIMEKIKPILHAHGFAMTFPPSRTILDHVTVRVVLAHKGGHREEAEFPFPYDRSDEKGDTHAAASAMSYGKRNMGSAILNLVTKDTDDDGRAANGKKRPPAPAAPPPPPGPPPSAGAPPPAAPPPGTILAVKGKAEKKPRASADATTLSPAAERAILASLETQIKSAKSVKTVEAMEKAFTPDIQKMSDDGKMQALIVISDAYDKLKGAKT
jgi:hypothetical protein